MSHPSLYENVDLAEMTEQRGSKVVAAARDGAQSGVEPCRRRKTLLHISVFLSSCVFLSLVLLLIGLLHGTWQFAKQQCSMDHSHLLVINSTEEQNFITEEANNTMYWIGLRDTSGGNWTWVDDTICRSSSMFWTAGEPNNWNGNTEDCVHIEDEGRWNDNQCSANLSWICEK
ncbi:hypothetical protein scyTo_0014120 [Scyliorhinus torazame]|uniref:C-type lectin domain-containing protein n=1 Tax=Scyliorhinus torazame TaxID=75743 RepID=A0A401NGU6_SCYTO|nr:hypothetical protein [Scyliorhinus torazame]